MARVKLIGSRDVADGGRVQTVHVEIAGPDDDRRIMVSTGPRNDPTWLEACALPVMDADLAEWVANRLHDAAAIMRGDKPTESGETHGSSDGRQ